MTVITDLKMLYKVNYNQWLEAMIELLKSKELEAIDYENLIEELEDLGNEQKRAVESLLEQVMRHLLMYQYWTMEYERNACHWEAEIYGFRGQLQRRLTTNLRNHLVREMSSIYQYALGYVRRKTRLNNLPQQCPYNLEQLLDFDWLP